MHRLDNLKAQRIAAGLSVAALARKANVSEHWINRGEDTATASGKGNPFPVRESQQIADALGVTLTTLGKADV
jgi:transcriptional regulator with XRE-family HTH domain